MAVYDEPVRGVVESMNGARFVHDELVKYGWEVLIADAQRVKGLAPLACQTDKVDARVLAELSFRDLVPAIWAADAGAAGRAGTLEIPSASGQASLDPQEPDPFDADRVRLPVPGV